MASLGPLIIDLAGGLSLSEDDRKRLRHPLAGGVILFSHNFQHKSQLRSLVREIKGLRSPPLLVTVDQEGGRVQRFRDGFTRLPPAAACGRLYESNPAEGGRLARDIGLVMAGELIDCGVDLSFAPVLDVLSCDSEVIGDRAFHSDPEGVHALASGYISGMNEAGMAAVGKHFPGHGGIGADSHTELPEDQRSLDDLRACDLVPYASLAGQLGGVMLAHVVYPKISPQIPSYSSFWIRNVLKDELGFQGAVFSDDLSMAGAGAEPLPERCQRALDASCDLLIVCHELPAVDKLMSEGRDTWALDDMEDKIWSLYVDHRPLAPRALEAARKSVKRASLTMG
ncbi:MAG: beta-N-acetylhexosaminidase [Arenicellales bacterium]